MPGPPPLLSEFLPGSWDADVVGAHGVEGMASASATPSVPTKVTLVSFGFAHVGTLASLAPAIPIRVGERRRVAVPLIAAARDWPESSLAPEMTR